MKSGISKTQSKLLYGIAIILMIYHHTFCIPSRLHYEYFSVLGFKIDFLNNSLETVLAWFCKICVAIFAFLTGYGFSKKLDFLDETPFKKLFHSYLIVIKKIFSLIFKLFLVLIVFVPLYYFVNNRCVSFIEFISNLFGISCSLNGEWWYVNFYFIICLLLPLFELIFYKGYKTKTSQIIFVSICSISMVSWLIFSSYMKYSIIVLEGYLIARFKVYELISNKIPKIYNKLLSLFFLLSCILVRIFLANEAAYMKVDMYIIIPFIYSILTLIPEDSVVSKGLCFLGKYSTYMWLTHTFFEYYLFSRFMTISGVSTLIFIQTIVVSILVSFAFMYAEEKLLKFGRFFHHKLINFKEKKQEVSN